MKRLVLLTGALTIAVIIAVAVGRTSWRTSLAQSKSRGRKVYIRCSDRGAVVKRFVKKIEPLFKRGTCVRFRYISSRLSVISQVLKKKVHVGVIMRRLTDVEKLKGLVDTQTGWQAYAVIVNARNIAQSLSTEDLRKILIGEIRNWSDVGGKNRTISILLPPEGSQIRRVIDEQILHGNSPTSEVKPSASDCQVIEAVERSSATIGFVAVSSIKSIHKKIAIVTLDGAKPVVADVVARKYPLRAPIMFITLDKPPKVLKNFFNFCLTQTGQKLMARYYFPVKKLKM